MAAADARGRHPNPCAAGGTGNSPARGNRAADAIGIERAAGFWHRRKKIGHASELKGEFKKIDTPVEIQKIIKLAGVICVAVALFCPLFLVVPVLLDHRLGLMTRVLAVAVLAITDATIVLSWRYNHKLLPVIRRQPLRRAVGMVCYGACLLWIRFGIFHVPPGGLHPRSMILPLFIFGLECTAIAILGGVGHGLEKAAAKKFEPIDLLASQI